MANLLDIYSAKTKRQTITSATDAEKDNVYNMDVSASSFTLTLPASPSVGDAIGFKSVNSTTFTATLGLSGLKFENDTGDITLSDKESGTLVYVSTAYGWGLATEIASSAGGDGISESEIKSIVWFYS